MIGQTQTFEAIADFLGQATRNSHGLRRAIDVFVESLQTFERVSIIDHAAESNDIESITIQRTPQMIAFYEAIERYQVANIEANQALTVAGSLAKSIADTQGTTRPR